MQMFHWPCVSALANYRNGDVIVLAEEVNTARAMALEYAKTYIKEEMEWLTWDDEDMKEKLDAFKEDFDVEPYRTTIIFIKGSE